jgi:RHS repeat-associated protein
MTRSVRGDLLVSDKEFPRDCKVDTLERSTRRIYLLNRYYDPSTDQFLSIDPDVQETDQPYVFTNDDPLNQEDPLGLSGYVGVPTRCTKNCGGDVVKAVVSTVASKLMTVSKVTGIAAAAGSTVLAVAALGLPEDAPGEVLVTGFSSAAGYVSAGSEIGSCAIDSHQGSCTRANLVLDAATLVSPPVINLLPTDARRYGQVASYYVDVYRWVQSNEHDAR